MSDETPPPASCAHNVHRIGDGRQPVPEPTDLCRNALGVFHMFDCPLTLGIPCAYYDQSPSPHATTSDLDIEAAREELSREFLGWRYRRRVRWLTKPKNLVPVGIVVDGPPEAEEVVPEILPMRALPPDAVVATGAAAPTDAAAGAPATSESVTAAVDASTPAKPSAPERYPGQRRSEERLAKKRARLAALDAAAAAKAAQIAAVTSNPPPDDGFGDDLEDDEGDEEGDDFGADVVDVEPVDTGPKTVEQVLASLPDAPIVMPNQPRRGQGPGRGGGRGGRGGRPGGPRGFGGGGGGGGQGGPPGGGGGPGGGPRRRRRRGRRGGGGPGGPGGGGQGGGGPRPPQRPPG